MTDMRQGVTETQNAVLDLCEEQADIWDRFYWPRHQMRMAQAHAKQAMRVKDLRAKRDLALMGAARLMHAAEWLGREIAEGKS